MTLGGDSIPVVARERQWWSPLASTPPGSPFRALPPYGSPMMEPTGHRGEKDWLLSAVLIQYSIDLFLIYLSLNINNKDKHNNALPKDVLTMFSTTDPLNVKWIVFKY
jgi:hypothetical protein